MKHGLKSVRLRVVFSYLTHCSISYLARYLISYLIVFATLSTALVTQAKNASVIEPTKPSVVFSKGYPSSNQQISELLNKYRKLGSLATLTKTPERYAGNIISWQMDHGGFGLHDASFYENPWDGIQQRSQWISKGIELGNFDDSATVAEVRFLAQVYSQSNNAAVKKAIKAAVARCLDFIFTAQYSHGGWPQVYPKRYGRTYSNNVTLNDDAMIRTMVLLSDILAKVPPFDTNLVRKPHKKRIYPKLTKAVDYLLKAQISNNNELTIWSSQYNQETYAPASARSYELVSKSGRESVGVLAYLMNWPEQTNEVIKAVTAGVTWYETNKIENVVLHKGVFSEKEGAELWYRFYEVDSNVPFFAGRDGIKKYDLSEVEEERRNGYSWGNNYASKILRAAPSYFDAQK